jgi:hypothetical protein
MKVAAVLSTMCFMMSLAFSGGLKKAEFTGPSLVRFSASCRPAASPPPTARAVPVADDAPDASAVADKYVVLSYM